MAKVDTLNNAGPVGSSNGYDKNTKKQRSRSPIRIFRSFAASQQGSYKGVAAQISNIETFDDNKKMITLVIIASRVKHFDQIGHFVSVIDGRSPHSTKSATLGSRTFHVVSKNSASRSIMIIVRDEADENSMAAYLYNQAEVATPIRLV